MKVLIVEDEIWAQKILEAYLISNFKSIKIKCTSNITDSVNAIKNFEPDLILLDINLGSESSFDIFKHFPEKKLNVIVVTSHQEFAYFSFKINAIDFLLKPINETELINSINKFSEKHDSNKQNKDRLLIFKNEKLFPIFLKDIIKIEADNQYSIFYLNNNQQIISSKSLLFFEKELNSSIFFRIHNSFIVNIEYIKNINNSIKPYVLLTNNEKIPISRRRKKILIDFFINIK